MKNLISLLILLFAFSSCNKNKQGTPCGSRLWAYQQVHKTLDTTQNVGIINTSTAAMTILGSFSGTSFTNAGTCNPSEGCYYTLGGYRDSGPFVLIKVTNSGVLTSYAMPTDMTKTVHYPGLTYNRFTNKLYCLKQVSGATQVVELNISGSAVTETVLDTTLYNQMANYTACATVNNSTGEMYFAFENRIGYSKYFIEKYNPSTGAHALVDSGIEGDIIGLEFNSNDNMLYAILENGTSKFVRFSLAGTHTVLSTFGFSVNEEFYSSTYDPCSRSYILSTPLFTSTGSGKSILMYIDSSGTVTRTDSSDLLHMGLDVDY